MGKTHRNNQEDSFKKDRHTNDPGKRAFDVAKKEAEVYKGTGSHAYHLDLIAGTVLFEFGSL